MYELKKMERYLGVNLLGPGPRLMKKEFTGPRSHKGWETLPYVALTYVHQSFLSRAVEALQGAHLGAQRNAHKQNSKFFLNISTLKMRPLSCLETLDNNQQ